MPNDTTLVVAQRAELLYSIIKEKLQELETIHNGVLENAKRRVEREKLNKIKKQISS